MMKNLYHLLSKAVFVTCGLTTTVLLPITVQANDSAGYVATGGVKYIKNKNISMHSEDLYISKDEIRVNYEFKNLSNKDITETILFPMPAIPSFIDSDYADIDATYDSFKVWVNGRAIQPKLHVRTFMHPLASEDKDSTYSDQSVDTTALFKSCGLTDAEMMNPWRYKFNFADVNKKLLNCTNKRLDKFINSSNQRDFSWDSQIIYSWQQTFKANSTTTVKHTYAPLVGGSVHLGEEEFGGFCVDDYTRHGFHESGARPYEALSYILTTGANWAKPIKDFTLTVERDKNELVSFCWQGKGKVKKIASNTFQIKESDFVPTHDFDVIFIHNKF